MKTSISVSSCGWLYFVSTELREDYFLSGQFGMEFMQSFNFFPSENLAGMDEVSGRVTCFRGI